MSYACLKEVKQYLLGQSGVSIMSSAEDQRWETSWEGQ